MAEMNHIAWSTVTKPMRNENWFSLTCNRFTTLRIRKAMAAEAATEKSPLRIVCPEGSHAVVVTFDPTRVKDARRAIKHVLHDNRVATSLFSLAALLLTRRGCTSSQAEEQLSTRAA